MALIKKLDIFEQWCLRIILRLLYQKHRRQHILEPAHDLGGWFELYVCAMGFEKLILLVCWFHKFCGFSTLQNILWIASSDSSTSHSLFCCHLMCLLFMVSAILTVLFHTWNPLRTHLHFMCTRQLNYLSADNLRLQKHSSALRIILWVTSSDPPTSHYYFVYISFGYLIWFRQFWLSDVESSTDTHSCRVYTPAELCGCRHSILTNTYSIQKVLFDLYLGRPARHRTSPYSSLPLSPPFLPQDWWD